MFQNRSDRLERIDTGDYTPAEYERFLREISFINRYLGDVRALKKTFYRDVRRRDWDEFSVLDVGAGSGEFLREIAVYAEKSSRLARLCGLELNAASASAILQQSRRFPAIEAVRGDALALPFADKSFDYVICSLFTHHFKDEKVVEILSEMNRVARAGIFVIDLHRHRLAYFFYRIFCRAFRISPLVTEDGSLSVLRSFKPAELETLARRAQLRRIKVSRVFPFRLVLEASVG